MYSIHIYQYQTLIYSALITFSEVQWSTGEDHTGGNGMGDEIEAAYEEFLRTQS